MTTDGSVLVTLVDDEDHELGLMEKVRAHSGAGHLHRAVSVCLFGADDRVLLQRRARTKYHFAGRWSNASCTHPLPGEDPAAAARRRVREELGLIVPRLVACGSFVYRAADPESGLVEHELDHVYAGRVGGSPRPDPTETEDLAWHAVDGDDLTPLSAPDFTPWTADVVRLALAGWQVSPSEQAGSASYTHRPCRDPGAP